MKDYRLASPYMRGPEVKVAQMHLGVSADGEYGPVTAGALKDWKHRFGYPAKLVTGVLHASDYAYLTGAKRQTRLQKLRAVNRARRAARAGGKGHAAVVFAGLRVGLTEDPSGSNVVPRLVADGKVLGVPASTRSMGYAWCAYFANLCALKAGSSTARDGLVKGLFNALYVPDILAHARAGRFGMRVVSWADAREGDFLIFNWDGGVPDHIGLLVKDLGNGTVRTREGNTSFDDRGSQSNGGAVAERVRSKSTIQAVVRWS